MLQSGNVIVRARNHASPCLTSYVDNIKAMSPSTASEYARRLKSFRDFIKNTYDCDVDNLLEKVRTNVENPYEVLINYRRYLQRTNTISILTLKQRVVTAKNFLEFYDIEFSPRKFKLKVKLPRNIRRNKEPLSKDDIITILNSCSDIRLKTYVMLLASTGLRAVEALSTRVSDYHFDTDPATLFVRGEFTKTKMDRTVYLTDEMTSQLKSWLHYRFRTRRVCHIDHTTGKTMSEYRTPIRNEKDLMFSVNRRNKTAGSPKFLYNTLLLAFGNTLDRMGKGGKEEGLSNKHSVRRKITLHSLRRYTKSTISDLGYFDFSEYFIGHIGSTYYRRTENDKKEIFRKVESYLTFLDVVNLDRKGADVQSKVDELEMVNQKLRERDAMNSDAIATLSDKLAQVMQEIEILKKQR